MKSRQPSSSPSRPQPPHRPPAAWRRLTGWLLVLAGLGMVLSGLSTVLHH